MQTVKEAKRVYHTRFTYSICTCEFYPIHFIHITSIDTLPVPKFQTLVSMLMSTKGGISLLAGILVIHTLQFFQYNKQ